MMDETGFFDLTQLFKDADAYIFLAGWLWMMYTKRVRWGWDYDKVESDLKLENNQLQEVITRYQDKVEKRLERLEAPSEEGGAK